LLGFSDCVKGAKNGDLHDATIQAVTAFTAKLDGFKFTPSVKTRDLGVFSRSAKGGSCAEQFIFLTAGKLVPSVMKAREAVREVLDELE
jgi:hypothetical protein